jgi:hypothetical protein
VNKSEIIIAAMINLGFRLRSSNVFPGSKKIFPRVANSDILAGSLGSAGGVVGGGGGVHSLFSSESIDLPPVVTEFYAKSTGKGGI